MMMSPLLSLQALADWRAQVAAGVRQLLGLLHNNGLLDDDAQAHCQALMEHLAAARLVLDLPAADAHHHAALTGAVLSNGAENVGAGVLDATDVGAANLGTCNLGAAVWPLVACSTELAWHNQTAPSLRLLPLLSRHAGRSLTQLRDDPDQWFALPLPLDDADGLAQALQQLARTRLVSLAEARALGFWPALPAGHKPAPDSDHRVSVPTWRHALLNYPHPLLQLGLVLQLKPAAGRLPADAQPPNRAALADSLRQLQRSLWSAHVPQHCDTLRVHVAHSLGQLQAAASRHLTDRRQQTAEQLDDLQQLRRRSAGRLHQLTLQLDVEAANFARCAPQLAALQALVPGQLPALLSGLSGHTVATAVQRMRKHSSTSLLHLAASRAFDQLGQTLQDQLDAATTALQACEGLLQTSQQHVNAEFRTRLACPPSPALGPAQDKLGRILQSHRRHVGLMQRWRLAQAGFMDRFCLVLQARLCRVFNDASSEIQAWAGAINSEIETQLRRRRRRLAHGRDSHDRLRAADDNLLKGIGGLQAQQDRQRLVGQQLAAELARLRRLLALGPVAAGATEASASVSASAPEARQETDTVAGMHPDTQRQWPLFSLQFNPQHSPQTLCPTAQAGDGPKLAQHAVLRRTAAARQCSGVA